MQRVSWTKSHWTNRCECASYRPFGSLNRNSGTSNEGVCRTPPYQIPGSRYPGVMQLVMRFTLLFCLVLFSSASRTSAHDVGEALLEQDPIWKRCCSGRDCTPQNVKIVGQEAREKVSVEIDGTQTKVDKRKLSPVPSARTWVCYLNPKGAIVNENIRCILFPEKGGNVHGPNPSPNQNRDT